MNSTLITTLLVSFGSTAAIISFIISSVIPLATSLVARQSWSRDLKGIITLFLAALTSFLTLYVQSLNDHTHFDWRTVVLTTIGNLIIALGTYFGWWKQGNIQAKLYAFPAPQWHKAKAVRTKSVVA